VHGERIGRVGGGRVLIRRTAQNHGEEGYRPSGSAGGTGPGRRGGLAGDTVGFFTRGKGLNAGKSHEHR